MYDEYDNGARCVGEYVQRRYGHFTFSRILGTHYSATIRCVQTRKSDSSGTLGAGKCTSKVRSIERVFRFLEALPSML